MKITVYVADSNEAEIAAELIIGMLNGDADATARAEIDVRFDG